MWMLKRVIWPNEFEVCSYSEDIIRYKEYYFQLFEDPSIKVKASVYEDLIRQYREDNFDYTTLNNAEAAEEARKSEREERKLAIEQKIYNSIGNDDFQRRGY